MGILRISAAARLRVPGRIGMTAALPTVRWILAGLVGLPAVVTVLWFGLKGLELSLVDKSSPETMIHNLSEVGMEFLGLL